MIDNTNQCQRLINLLRIRGSRGIFVYEIIAPRPQGLGIAQYNTRISELRDMDFGIKNVKPGHFVLTYDCGKLLRIVKPKQEFVVRDNKAIPIENLRMTQLHI